MNDWTAGYVADIGYTYGYYTELNPLRASVALLNQGLAPPVIRRACELGFGQGVSIAMHAAGQPVDWWGNDFNPAQAALAQELAGASGAAPVLSDESFAEFAAREDLPEFDYIGLHGIWSWISDENRHIIVEFIRRRLAVGGVLYISYNTLPGWAAFAPVRHLITRHADVGRSEGSNIVSRIEDALDFGGRMLETNPLFLRANPQIKERMDKLKEQDRSYLAHEYFNRDWHPMHFATMEEWLTPAKLNYAGSANYLDHIDGINMTADQQTFLKEVTDPSFRESVRDFMVNQQFRRDYWVRGARRLTPLEQMEALRRVTVVLILNRPDISLKVKGALGEAGMNESIYAPLLDELADHRVRSLGELEQALQSRDIGFPQLVEAVMILSGSGSLALAQDEESIEQASEKTERLNGLLMERARSRHEVSYLVSPVTGGGIPVGRFPQLFLLARRNGHKKPEDWARFTWELLRAQGQHLLKEGKALESEEDNLAELHDRASAFNENQLPILRALRAE